MPKLRRLGLARKVIWIQKLHREGILDGPAMTRFMRELYEAEDFLVLCGIAGDMLFKDVIEVCNGRACVVGDTSGGFTVVSNVQN